MRDRFALDCPLRQDQWVSVASSALPPVAMTRLQTHCKRSVLLRPAGWPSFVLDDRAERGIDPASGVVLHAGQDMSTRI